MRRRHYLLTGCLLVGCLSLSAGVIGFLVLHVPVYYRSLSIAESPYRTQAARAFQANISKLMDSFINESVWSTRFTPEQINCYFQEDFVHSGGLDPFSKANLHEPRIMFLEDRLRIAVRYGQGFWSTILTVDVRFWVAAAEPNVVVLELLGVRAGALPMPSQWLLESIAEATRTVNIEVNWYRHDGHPVALMRFQADQIRPTYQILNLRIDERQLMIEGQSLDPPF